MISFNTFINVSVLSSSMSGFWGDDLLIVPGRGIKAAQDAANRMALSTVVSLKQFSKETGRIFILWRKHASKFDIYNDVIAFTDADRYK